MSEPDSIDPIDALFSAEALAEMRASITEATGEVPTGTPRELVGKVLENNLRHIAEKLEPMIDLAIKLGESMDEGVPGHALFTLGQAVESMTTARALLLGRALGEIHHALECGRNPNAHAHGAAPNMNPPPATH